MSKVTEYFESVRKEMNKVTWPTQKELVDNTTVVMIFTIVVSLFIFGIDNVYSFILELLYN
jgi:preprotein translocase subunit SecE